MNLLEIFSIIFIHWVADFVLQTDWEAKNKSKSWDALLSHTLTYSNIWLMASFFFIVITNTLNISSTGTVPAKEVLKCFYFAGITFMLHTITDYFTSRLNSKLWAKGDVHNFFVSVGFDQVLHYIQLFLTYYLLKQL